MPKSFLMMYGPYKNHKILGPYILKRENRTFVSVINFEGRRRYNILLARFRLETMLNRRLGKDEQAHHKDEDSSNDDPKNLEVQPFKKHQAYHIRKRMEQHRQQAS